MRRFLVYVQDNRHNAGNYSSIKKYPELVKWSQDAT